MTETKTTHPQPTTVELAPMDSCIVFRADGQKEIYLPSGDDDDPVPEGTMQMMRMLNNAEDADAQEVREKEGQWLV